MIKLFSGPKSHNQIYKLQGLLKDDPVKLGVSKPGIKLLGVPPLGVVQHPTVDPENWKSGPPYPLPTTALREKTFGFHPGPYKERTSLHQDNRIPAHNYTHNRYAKLKGKDFK